jgi:predicted ATPase
VLLTGEPGMGKSRLAREFARHAQAEGAVVLHGHCDAEPLAPYQPFTAGIRFYLANSDAVPDEDLAPLVPELRRRRAPGLPGAPESERYQLFEAVARLLTEASARHPLVLVIDDLHWADKPTILLLRHVVERTAQAPVLLVCTARAEEMADPLTQLWRDPACERLALAGFDDGETAELVAAHLKRDPSAGFVKRMRERTAGNPFFIGEVLRAGASEQALDRIPVPEGVKELIGQRLNTLTDDTRRVLALAAVLGPEFKVTVLEALAGEDDVLTALEAAEAAGLVHEAQADRFAFAHALVRETLYERPSASRRVRGARAPLL